MGIHDPRTRGTIGLGSANLSGACLAGVIWAGADLRGMNLSGANLSGANLREANLSGVNLSGANLQDAILTDAKLSHANLSGANLTGADLRWTTFDEANLSQSNLQHANLEEADLRSANLCGARMDHITSLTQSQVKSAHIDPGTRLPETLPIVWLAGDRYLLGNAARDYLAQKPRRNPLRVFPAPLSRERIEELFGPMAGCGMAAPPSRPKRHCGPNSMPEPDRFHSPQRFGKHHD